MKAAHWLVYFRERNVCRFEAVAWGRGTLRDIRHERLRRRLGAGETWKTLKRPRFLLLNLSGIVYRNTSKITTQCYSQGINDQKCVGKFWYLKYFSCGVHLRNTSRLFLATQTLDADIWKTNQNIQKAWHTFVYWYFVNDFVHSFCSCCGIRCPINSLEGTSVVSTLTTS